MFLAFLVTRVISFSAALSVTFAERVEDIANLRRKEFVNRGADCEPGNSGS
jgi:hypothetical protein